MKIYTKGGDQGETGLYGGARVSKNSGRIHAYGTLDELNATMGWVLAAAAEDANWGQILLRIQSELFQMGAELATPPERKLSVQLIETPQVEALEKEIDRMESELEPLKTFILPGGCELASRFHIARTVARRAEREIVALAQAEKVRPMVIQYVNRLSDALFVMARFANKKSGISDIPWKTPN